MTGLRATGSLTLLCSAACLGCAQGQAQEPDTIDLCEYELAHAEEFDSLSVAPRKLENGVRWTAHTPWNGDFGDAAFADPGPDGPFSVTDGVLTITARKGDNGKWRSGLLAAADASGAGWGEQYGYFEARMRFSPGPGTWPAFWLMSLQPAKQSPKIEIDAVEYYGHNTDAYFVTGHVWYADKAQGETTHEGKEIDVPDGSLVADFHRYGVRVDPQAITYFLDGREVWRQPTPPEHTAKLYPLVNLALGSGYSIEGTPDPSFMEVDYVRIYRPAKDSDSC